jgi:F-type H+-transporting ATPase subunit alpha
MNVEDQVIGIYLGVNGYLDDLPISSVRPFEKFVLNKITSEHADIMLDIRTKKEISAETNAALKDVIDKYLEIFTRDIKKNE